MYRDRLQAAQIINRLLEFDGTTADDIRRAAILYLSDFETYLEERERHGSSVDAG